MKSILAIVTICKSSTYQLLGRWKKHFVSKTGVIIQLLQVSYRQASRTPTHAMRPAVLEVNSPNPILHAAEPERPAELEAQWTTSTRKTTKRPHGKSHVVVFAMLSTPEVNISPADFGVNFDGPSGDSAQAGVETPTTRLMHTMLDSRKRY